MKRVYHTKYFYQGHVTFTTDVRYQICDQHLKARRGNQQKRHKRRLQCVPLTALTPSLNSNIEYFNINQYVKNNNDTFYERVYQPAINMEIIKVLPQKQKTNQTERQGEGPYEN